MATLFAHLLSQFHSFTNSGSCRGEKASVLCRAEATAVLLSFLGNGFLVLRHCGAIAHKCTQEAFVFWQFLHYAYLNVYQCAGIL